MRVVVLPRIAVGVPLVHVHVQFGQRFEELAKTGFADQIMTHAPLAMFFAKVAGLMGEAGGPLDGGKGGGGDAGVQAEIDAIIKDLKGPYYDADHADHKATVEKVAALYARKHAGGAR